MKTAKGQDLHSSVHLVTRADDVGMCHSVNTAALNALHKGILRNISLIVPAPGFAEAAEMFRGEKDACLGLHATITCEWAHQRWGPVEARDKVPGLVAAEGGMSRTAAAVQARGATATEIMVEIQAQLALARRHGLTLHYIDEHMSFGWLPGLQERLHAFAQKEGLVYGHGFLPALPELEEDVSDPVDKLLKTLNVTEPGVYLKVSHPAYDGPDLRAFGRDPEHGAMIAEQRNGQRLIMMDPRVVEYCRRYDVKPIRYTDVG